MKQTSSPTESTSSSFFSPSSRKRFREHALPPLPILTLDREGTILTLTRAARRALEYSDDASIDDYFFSHVHKRNVRRVMHDLANMVSRGKQRAKWLLRLRTGNGRWRWYRAAVQNKLGRQDGHIRIRLRPM
jgi:PAS domain-containing protein